MTGLINIAPFIFLFVCVLKFVGLVATPCLLVAHIALFLLAQISPSIRCSLGNRVITDISSASSVLIHAQTNAGKDRVCKLHHNIEEHDQKNLIVAGVEFPPTSTYFVFQNVKYAFDSEKNAFSRVVYPTSSTLGDFCSHTGHQTNDAVIAAFNKWGRNEFDIPMPEFVDLYLVRHLLACRACFIVPRILNVYVYCLVVSAVGCEQQENLVAPFFIFQILCLLLWSLDDYWYYSLVTMLMLFFFEALMANQRLAGLQTLRAMRSVLRLDST